MRKIKSFQSKKGLVYESLRAGILEGELKPGSRLVIDELAEDLGVSQIPVREALQKLQADGYVEIRPYIGARVTEIHASSITEIFILLEAMEVISGRAACEQMSEDDLDELAAIVRTMDGSQDDPEGWSHENVHLHQFICERSETPLVGVLVGKVLDQWDRLRRYYLNDVFADRIRIAQKEHLSLLDALRSRDPDQVERVIREHNQGALQAYVDHLSSFESKETELAG
jgi:DNA-binding GntR family transcriptional regulator